MGCCLCSVDADYRDKTLMLLRHLLMPETSTSSNPRFHLCPRLLSRSSTLILWTLEDSNPLGMRTELTLLLLISLTYHGKSPDSHPNTGLDAGPLVEWRDERSKEIKEAGIPHTEQESRSTFSMEVVFDTFLDLVVSMQLKLVIHWTQPGQYNSHISVVGCCDGQCFSLEVMVLRNNHFVF